MEKLYNCVVQYNSHEACVAIKHLKYDCRDWRKAFTILSLISINLNLKSAILQEFSGDPVVGLLPLRVQVQSLVGELRSYKPCGTAK